MISRIFGPPLARSTRATSSRHSRNSAFVFIEAEAREGVQVALAGKKERHGTVPRSGAAKGRGGRSLPAAASRLCATTAERHA
jgi:hypothetical protein